MVGKGKGKEVWIPRSGIFMNKVFRRILLSHGKKEIKAMMENLMLLFSGSLVTFAFLIMIFLRLQIYFNNDNPFHTALSWFIFISLLLSFLIVMFCSITLDISRKKNIIIMDDNTFFHVGTRSVKQYKWSDIQEGYISYDKTRTRDNYLKTNKWYYTLILKMDHDQKKIVKLSISDNSLRSFRKEIVEYFREKRIPLHWPTSPDEGKVEVLIIDEKPGGNMIEDHEMK